MSNSKDPQSYLLAAGGLATLAAGITYCAVNWDSPPDWWPNRLQPWWNKKEPEQKQTDQYVKQEDDTEPVAAEPVAAEPVVKEVTEDLVKPENVEVNVSKK